jgi:hypothetical protein
VTRGPAFLAVVVAAMPLVLQPTGVAQNRDEPTPTNQPPKAAAPIDVTGYWVSVVTEDWRYRMVTPAKGDYQGVPMTPEAVKVADGWDPAADEAGGSQCKSYGAAAIMRVPGRLHITWQDDSTLRVEADAGTQTRVFRFNDDQPKGGERSWQGMSVARWELPTAGRGRAAGSVPAASVPKGGSLKVVTSNMRAGYLRKNGVPYSEEALLTEHFDLAPYPNGGQLLVVTSVVEDSKYLRQPFIVSTQFRKQADASGWEPTPCSSTW